MYTLNYHAATIGACEVILNWKGPDSDISRTRMSLPDSDISVSIISDSDISDSDISDADISNSERPGCLPAASTSESPPRPRETAPRAADARFADLRRRKCFAETSGDVSSSPGEIPRALRRVSLGPPAATRRPGRHSAPSVCGWGGGAGGRPRDSAGPLRAGPQAPHAHAPASLIRLEFGRLC